MTVTIRAAIASDEAGWVAAAEALFAADSAVRDPHMDQSWPRRFGPDAFRQGLTDPGRLLLVAEADSAVVGTLSASVADGPRIRPVRVATIRSLVVVAAHRGAGVGGRLMRRFQEWAAAQGARRMSVMAYSTNADAIRFYERSGFAPFEVTLEGDVPGA